MREIELKGVVDDLVLRRTRLLDHGATQEYVGRLEDRRYDTPERALELAGKVLRIRAYRPDRGAAAVSLDWKDTPVVDDGYRTREELSVEVESAERMSAMLGALGYVVTRAIDREIEMYRVRGAIVRFERYPRMDLLVEVEGSPESIEAAITVLGLPRASFTSESLAAFVERFEARTGMAGILGHGDASIPAETFGLT